MPTNYSIAEVETAIVTALTTQMAAYVKTCKSYQGELEDDIDKVLLLTPAALVVFNARKSKALSQYGHAQQRRMSFTVYLVAKDLRGEATARTKAAGIYAMIEDCDTALLDQKLDLDVPYPIRGGDAELIMTRKHISVFAVEYAVDVYKV